MLSLANIFRGKSASVETKSAPNTSGVAFPEQWFLDQMMSAPVQSGVSVNARSAMTCTAVACAVNAISQAVGQLPIHVYAKGDDGSRERDPDHPVANLLRHEVNDWTPASTFRETLTSDALLHRVGGLAEIIRIEGRPVELHRFDPETVTLMTNGYGAPAYRISGPNGGRVLPYTDVLHLQAPTGCPTHLAREAIGLALTLEQHAARLFGNGARPSGTLKFPKDLKLDAEDMTRIVASWNATHSGSNSGKTAILYDGGDWMPLTFNSVDAQFLEMRNYAIAEIARAFRVPPVLLMDYGRATWGNSEEMGRQFVTYTLLPWLKRWEGEIRLKLFSRDERENYFAEFLTDDLLRADLEKRATAYSSLISSRVLNPNEVRALENRPPYAGGDEYANPNTTTGAPSNV